MDCKEGPNYNLSAAVWLHSKLMFTERQTYAVHFNATTTIMPKLWANQYNITQSELHQTRNYMSNKYKCMSGNKCTEIASVTTGTV
jgi:hypothetical protein